jgi:hypothetical protein
MGTDDSSRWGINRLGSLANVIHRPNHRGHLLLLPLPFTLLLLLDGPEGTH